MRVLHVGHPGQEGAARRAHRLFHGRRLRHVRRVVVGRRRSLSIKISIVVFKSTFTTGAAYLKYEENVGTCPFSEQSSAFTFDTFFPCCTRIYAVDRVSLSQSGLNSHKVSMKSPPGKKKLTKQNSLHSRFPGVPWKHRTRAPI